jgi:DNA-binding CsgD family transcriptional regulator
LTSRQQEILDLLTAGRRTREIASALGISERAVTAHISRLMEEFRAHNRTELVAAVVTAPGARAAASDVDLMRYSDAPFLVAVTDGPSHVFRFVNDMWERVMHLRAKDVIGKTVSEVFPNASPVTYAARQRAFREGQPTTGNAWHYKWTSRDGRRREADFRYLYQPLRDRRGKVTGLLLIATEALD